MEFVHAVFVIAEFVVRTLYGIAVFIGNIINSEQKTKNVEQSVVYKR
jgi:hypothetical protein